MDLYDRKMVTNTNLKYAYSSLNYYIIIMVQNFFKCFNSNISKKIRILEALNANLMQTTTAKLLLFAQDTSLSDLASVFALVHIYYAKRDQAKYCQNTFKWPHYSLIYLSIH